jgi:sugar-specific transcriptional regulator TrmB
MSADPTDVPRDAAVERLKQFGLSTYAARTYVALVGLGTGTAAEVSRVTDVPRPRVYDAADELRERGLADVQQGTPRRFRPVSVRTAIGRFEQEFQRRRTALETALETIEPVDSPAEQRGVWTVDGREAVEERVLELVASAEEEVVYMTVEELLTDRLVEGLETAAGRGVRLRLGDVSGDVGDRIRKAVPGAEPFESIWLWSDTPAGRLLLIDERTTLVSVRLDDGEGRQETAIWGAGDANGLVVVLRALFTWRLRASD